MNGTLQAVIFDMDGVLIDSEPLWRRAMIRAFTECGVNFTEEDCRKTTGRRFDEVARFWIQHHQITMITAVELETRVVNYLLELIHAEGRAIDGVLEVLKFCQSRQLKIGLATSSAHVLMNAILEKLNLTSSFDAVISAEYLEYGKPHPEVFLRCAKELGIAPQNCLVIEDSVNGVVAAKAAQMRVIAVPDKEHWGQKQFALADDLCERMSGALEILKNFA